MKYINTQDKKNTKNNEIKFIVTNIFTGNKTLKDMLINLAQTQLINIEKSGD